MEDKEYYNPDFIDANFLDSQLEMLGISTNFGTKHLSDYIYGIDGNLLDNKKDILQKDVKFKKQFTTQEKRDVVQTLNDLRLAITFPDELMERRMLKCQQEQVEKD